MSASEFPRSTTLTPAQRRRQSGIQKIADGLMEALEASEEIGEERVRDALDERYGQIDQRFAQIDQRFTDGQSRTSASLNANIVLVRSAIRG